MKGIFDPKRIVEVSGYAADEDCSRESTTSNLMDLQFLFRNHDVDRLLDKV
jgi:hypothetical protein